MSKPTINTTNKERLSKFVFEQATENQADMLVEFEQTIAVPKLYSKPLDLPGAIKEIQENIYYFIKHDGVLVGTAAYCKREDGSCYISNMAVGPAYRGQGIARAALELLMDKCANSHRIDLVTHPENFRSIPLYESFGFVIESRIENYYGDGEPRVVMAKGKSWPNISTKRCILRLPNLEESQLMCNFAIQNKAYLQQWEPLQPDNYYTNDYWMDKILQLRADFLNDKSCCLNIYLQENQQLIGIVNYSNFVRGAFQSCFLGFKIAEEMQGKGLMTEALQVSIAYIFETLNLHRIAANYMPHNIASAKVLEKCRFRQEGIAEDYLYINGKWEKHILTSLINHEWKNKGNK